MKKISLSVAALLIASASFSQTKCKGLTKDSVQCKNTVKVGELCYLHNPNYVKPSKTVAVVCTGTTKSGKNCKNKTKNSNQLCYLHNKKD